MEMAKPYLDPRAGELLAAAPAPRRALFLDRDGVINVDHGYVHKPENTEWMPGIFELCAKARQAGYLLVVVTNQAGIARGYYSTDEFLTYTKWMHEQFSFRDIPLTATYYCPHHPAFTPECPCRKPAPGLICTAISDLGLDKERCVLIGDKATDTEAGAAAGLAENLLMLPSAAMYRLFQRA